MDFLLKKNAALSVSFFKLKMPSYQAECRINEENPFQYKMKISSQVKTKWTNKSKFSTGYPSSYKIIKSLHQKRTKKTDTKNFLNYTSEKN